MTQKSSDQLLESLSALVDNEASELEVRRILKNVERNPEVRERWRRYNMIGSILRKESDLNLGGAVDLAGGISEALLAEQAFTGGAPERMQDEPRTTQGVRPVTSSSRKGLLDFIAKSAVAASFAGALVIGFNVFGPEQSGEFQGDAGYLANLSAPQQRPASGPVVTSAPLGFDLPPLESRTVGSNSGGQSANSARMQALSTGQVDDLTDVATQNLLNELLIHHAARASSNGSLGIMPFARVSQMQPVEASK